MSYLCTNCQKIFKSRQGLTYHKSHLVCQDKHTCKQCFQTFSTKQMYQYHLKHNVCQKKKTTLKLKSPYDLLSREELIIKLSHVEGKYEALKENPQNTNNNIIVFPSAFGKEDMDYIRSKLGDILGPIIKTQPFRCIPTLIGKIHNNQTLPEYHNVYIKNERSNYALISDGKTFVHRPKKTIIDQIIEDKRSILNRYVDDNGEQLGDKVLKKYELYQNQLDDNVEFQRELELEIGGLLLDMKSVIANDDKTRKLLDKVNEGQFELSHEDESNEDVTK